MEFILMNGERVTGFSPAETNYPMIYLNVAVGIGILYRYVWAGDVSCIDVLVERPKV